MVKIVYVYGGRTYEVEVSPETHEKLRKVSEKLGIPIHEVVYKVHRAYGGMTEGMINLYLKGFE